MNQVLQLLTRSLKSRLLSSCILSLSLAVSPVALADYRPPCDQKTASEETRSEGGTTRGCEGAKIPLTLLASRNYVGQTTSTHPTFAWFVPYSKSLPMKFEIYGFGVDGTPQEVFKIELQTSPGIKTLSPFPEGKPGLEMGKEYLWQVIIICDPSSPSSASVDRANIEVVEVSSTLQSNLDNTVDSLKKANIYAEAGLWYDALAEALKLAQKSKLGEVGSAMLEDLAIWEKPENPEELPLLEREQIEKRIDNFRQIANNER